MQTPPIGPVLILTNQLSVGGAEVYVVTVSSWLAEQGIDVAVAATPGDLVKKLHPRVDYYPVPLRDVRWSLPLAVQRVRKVAEQVKPKAIVANSLVTAWIGKLATLRASTPILEVAHGWPVARYGTVAKLMRPPNDQVVPVSVEVERRLRDGGLPDSQMTVVANGVDLSPFTKPSRKARNALRKEAFGAGTKDFVITNTGRYAEQKAQHHIIEIARQLKPTHPHLRFGVIGYGEREEELQLLIERHDVAEQVRLTGKRSDVPALLMASDVYLNCSNWEGMPLSTIEAMGAGLALVCTKTEGIGALMPTGDNGFVVPVGDPTAMADAIRTLADDSRLRKRMGKASRKLAEQQFSKERMCSELAKVIAEVIG